MARLTKTGKLYLTADDVAAYDRLRTSTKEAKDIQDLVPNLNRSVRNAQIRAFYELDEDERKELFGDNL